MEFPITTKHLLINRLASDRIDGLRINTTPAQVGARAISLLIQESKTSEDEPQAFYFLGQRPGMPQSEVWVYTSDGVSIEPFIPAIIETTESAIASLQNQE